MFTGIVETTGTINDIETIGNCLRVNISPHIVFSDLKIGDSVAINGTCLTVTDFSKETFTVEIVAETQRVTNLKKLSLGSIVNLERSMKSGERISGHYVQGHVDGVGEILEMNADPSGALCVKILVPEQLEKYIVNKGYISLDGMSITIIEANANWFTVTFIPHTQQITIIKRYKVGTKINIEVDILGKYVEKILRTKYVNTH